MHDDTLHQLGYLYHQLYDRAVDDADAQQKVKILLHMAHSNANLDALLIAVDQLILIEQGFPPDDSIRICAQKFTLNPLPPQIPPTPCQRVKSWLLARLIDGMGVLRQYYAVNTRLP